MGISYAGLRRIWRLGLSLVLSLAATAAAAQEVAPNEAILYGAEGFAGTGQSWQLSEGQPFSAIPYLGEGLAGRVGSIKLGASLGLLLFQRPYFAARDEVCGLKVGIRQAPELWWQGRTALTLPAAGQNEGQAIDYDAFPSGQFSSMILFRRDLGPPPGALLLERRLVIATNCGETMEANRYNRLFVPTAMAPEREVCLDVSAPSQSPGAGKKAPKFTRSDELILLQPQRLDSAYASSRHAIQVLLFDAPGCAGDSVGFPRRKARDEAFLLDDYEFRNKTRSILVRYSQGAYDPFLGPPLPSTTPALFAGGTSQTAKSDTLSGSSSGSALARAIASSEQSASPSLSIPAPASAAGSTGRSDDAASAETMVSQALPPEPPAPTGPSLQPPAPAPMPQAFETPNQAAAAGSQNSDPTLVPAVPQVPASVAQPQDATPPPANLREAVQTAEGDSAAQSGSQIVVPQSDGQIAINPQPRPPASGKRFEFPVHELYRLNFCAREGIECGGPAAAAWCQTQGFGGALSWKREPHTGALFPTIRIGDRGLCDKYLCDGFAEIVCGN